VAVRVTAPRAARAIGIAWVAGRPLVSPAAAFRDFALTYAGQALTASPVRPLTP